MGGQGISTVLVKVRTILNFEPGVPVVDAAPVTMARPAGGLFRMGESASAEGFWSRWSGACFLAVVLHAGVVAAALSVTKLGAQGGMPSAGELDAFLA